MPVEVYDDGIPLPRCCPPDPDTKILAPPSTRPADALFTWQKSTGDVEFRFVINLDHGSPNSFWLQYNVGKGYTDFGTLWNYLTRRMWDAKGTDDRRFWEKGLEHCKEKLEAEIKAYEEWYSEYYEQLKAPTQLIIDIVYLGRLERES
jgi:hypothetical protein